MPSMESSPARFAAVFVNGSLVRTTLLVGLASALLFACQALWPRFALTCVRHPADSTVAPTHERALGQRAPEDVDCSFARVSLLGPDGSWAVQDETFFLELRNATVVREGTRWAVQLLTGGQPRSAVELAAFSERAEADALAGQLAAFLAATRDPKHAGDLLRFTLTSDTSWAVGLAAGALLGVAAALAVLVRSGRHSLELSASTGTATVVRSGLVPLCAAHRSVPLERLVRVAVASAGGEAASSARGTLLRLEVGDAVSGTRESIDVGVGSSLGAESVALGLPCCKVRCSLQEVVRACGSWIRAYAETGMGTDAPLPSAVEEPGEGVVFARGAQRRGGAALVGTAAAATDFEDPDLGSLTALAEQGESDSGVTGAGAALTGAGEAPPTVAPSPAGEDACVICKSQRPCVALVPCRHLCLCAVCARSVSNGRLARCPVCRADVASTLRVMLI